MKMCGEPFSKRVDEYNNTALADIREECHNTVNRVINHKLQGGCNKLNKEEWKIRKKFII